MKNILQIFSGSWHAANHKPEEVIEKIKSIASRITVDKVIIGWNTDASAYQKIGAFLHELGIQMLLWLPVFSEISEVSEPDQAMDLFGQPVIPPFHQAGEDFLFGCPSSRRNIQIVKDIYERFFSGCGFDGVFLDKIRGQSFLAGVSGVLSCGCGKCREAYLKKGVDLNAVRRDYEAGKDAFFDLAAYPMNGEFRLKDALAQRFFEAKEELIADAVAELCQYFKNKGLIVGLDLFAPVISRFVGQNYALLTKHADFIKPMLYRKTTAPAGIGYEYALFERHAPKAQGRIRIQMDRSFLDAQLEAVSHAACEKYPGIEINYREDIARTDAGYITESLSAVKTHRLEGAALCWNVMLAPQAHIDAISRMENTTLSGS